MNSSSKKKNSFDSHPKENAYEYNSTLYITDDDSDYDEAEEKSKLKNAKLTTNGNKNIDLANLKQLPNLFFLFFIISIFLVAAKFIPHVWVVSKNGPLYEQKFLIHYFPQVMSEAGMIVKVEYF